MPTDPTAFETHIAELEDAGDETGLRNAFNFAANCSMAMRRDDGEEIEKPGAWRRVVVANYRENPATAVDDVRAWHQREEKRRLPEIETRRGAPTFAVPAPDDELDSPYVGLDPWLQTRCPDAFEAVKQLCERHGADEWRRNTARFDNPLQDLCFEAEEHGGLTAKHLNAARVIYRHALGWLPQLLDSFVAKEHEVPLARSEAPPRPRRDPYAPTTADTTEKRNTAHRRA